MDRRYMGGTESRLPVAIVDDEVNYGDAIVLADINVDGLMGSPSLISAYGTPNTYYIRARAKCTDDTYGEWTGWYKFTY